MSVLKKRKRHTDQIEPSDILDRQLLNFRINQQVKLTDSTLGPWPWVKRRLDKERALTRDYISNFSTPLFLYIIKYLNSSYFQTLSRVNSAWHSFFARMCPHVSMPEKVQSRLTNETNLYRLEKSLGSWTKSFICRPHKSNRKRLVDTLIKLNLHDNCPNLRCFGIMAWHMNQRGIHFDLISTPNLRLDEYFSTYFPKLGHFRFLVKSNAFSIHPVLPFNPSLFTLEIDMGNHLGRHFYKFEWIRQLSNRVQRLYFRVVTCEFHEQDLEAFKEWIRNRSELQEIHLTDTCGGKLTNILAKTITVSKLPRLVLLSLIIPKYEWSRNFISDLDKLDSQVKIQVNGADWSLARLSFIYFHQECSIGVYDSFIQRTKPIQYVRWIPPHLTDWYLGPGEKIQCRPPIDNDRDSTYYKIFSNAEKAGTNLENLKQEELEQKLEKERQEQKKIEREEKRLARPIIPSKPKIEYVHKFIKSGIAPTKKKKVPKKKKHLEFSVLKVPECPPGEILTFGSGPIGSTKTKPESKGSQYPVFDLFHPWNRL